ncbi:MULTISPECIES: hypothetical protein [Micromonospora]|uniref:hypothetical protein n=1 Tax=Micromonospora TaxID=1873 RepID=UPI0024161707|nr:hypothetical protein [Micromonospora sp. WMMD718]MDG4749333.1 hypothetical protein [Micromonospora sp. WMMD718]MDG4756075.1 hypothetical protein [Micromonospora sp. WMMD718]
MEITLDTDQVQLLVAVDQKRVHMDPRYTRPDFERDPGPPVALKRATQRLQPLKRMHLVELVDESEADRYGVRLYKLTARGEQVLAEVREMEAAARAEAGA